MFLVCASLSFWRIQVPLVGSLQSKRHPAKRTSSARYLFLMSIKSTLQLSGSIHMDSNIPPSKQHPLLTLALIWGTLLWAPSWSKGPSPGSGIEIPQQDIRMHKPRKRTAAPWTGPTVMSVMSVMSIPESQQNAKKACNRLKSWYYVVVQFN